MTASYTNQGAHTGSDTKCSTTWNQTSSVCYLGDKQGSCNYSRVENCEASGCRLVFSGANPDDYIESEGPILDEGRTLTGEYTCSSIDHSLL